MAFKIGIISDTHGLLRPEAVRRLTGVDHIIHGGDIGRPDVIAELRGIAPVTAIRGNVDKGDWAADYADTELVRLAVRLIYLVHDQMMAEIVPGGAGIRCTRNRRDRNRAHPCAEDRYGRRGTLFKFRKRGATAFQVADHACYP